MQKLLAEIIQPVRYAGQSRKVHWSDFWP